MRNAILATRKQNKYFNFYRFFTLIMNTNVNQFSLLTPVLGNCYGLHFSGDAKRHKRKSVTFLEKQTDK